MIAFVTRRTSRLVISLRYIVRVVEMKVFEFYCYADVCVIMTAYDYCLVLPVDPAGSVTKSGRKVEGFTPQGLECVRHLNSV